MAPTDPTAAVRLIDAATRVLASCGDDDVASVVLRLDDDDLLTLMTDASAARSAIDVIVAAASAEVGRRSVRELGYAGLAQRKGHRNATSLVQNITGQSRGDVFKAIRTGEDLVPPPNAAPVAGGDATPPPVVSRWLVLLRGALSAGRVGQAKFQAIRGGLGEPPVDRYPDLDPDFLPAAWAEAVEILLAEAASTPVEELRNAARTARDRLDPIGVTLRFEERFAARSFRTWIDEHGQHHARIDFDDEAAAWVHAIVGGALRPRRGPRFVGSDAGERARAADHDERSNEQLQYDTLIAVLRTGANADPAQAFGDRQPGVRVTVDASAIGDAERRGEMHVRGVGHLEDTGAALPGGIIEKLLCDAGATSVQLDAFGRPLDVGRDQRLFTRKQRIAIAIRDGGCLWPSCVAPISECEFHHADHWWADHGRTDVDDGVPLCRNCHMRLHNQGWRIRRTRDPITGIDGYWLHPPPDAETGQTAAPLLLQSKSPRRFQAA
ncbi:hypothetical protein GCM10009775_26550 [Microbacterium aoyamense]|uniref:HNH nuclease domain-containing protein n=1 Tax=Microbacterium aoyamense TaxID=344166 RepID=A0ABN2PVD5_9MICO|nr:HNH endonuclease signature motif containing protein [Microbacterium aoyamense]